MMRYAYFKNYKNDNIVTFPSKLYYPSQATKQTEGMLFYIINIFYIIFCVISYNRSWHLTNTKIVEKNSAVSVLYWAMYAHNMYACIFLYNEYLIRTYFFYDSIQ